jgi:hypothetical protein
MWERQLISGTATTSARPLGAIGLRDSRSNCDPWIGLSTVAHFRWVGRDPGYFRRGLLSALSSSPGRETVVIHVLIKFGSAPLSPGILMVLLVSSAVVGGVLFAYGVERPLNRILQGRLLPSHVPTAPLPV